MTVLLHLCCGPCTIFPLTALRDQGFSVQGYFFNPNIHPFREFRQRLTTLEDLAQRMALPVEYHREYGLREYLRRVVLHEEGRCPICYELRLEATAKKARDLGAEAFSTTLLYSRYQRHETIRALGEKLAAQYGVHFLYEDFRVGWQEGIDTSIEMGLYRQPYCGCIYSEQERYDKKFRKGKGTEG
ncbi:MAG: epoxyqueuosine reductase QueH [Desulfobulbaceae bacterium]|nr:epoxyqueuosine reductase QueH [Desulfobulbaceae bacterium]HIJ91002.1 epoxyqueuosine reductase QueH [Deltaproteobacteria bacterium]